MARIKVLLIAASALSWSGAATAQSAEVGYPRDSLGMTAILSGDYSTAERQIRASSVSQYDPARSLNLGLVMLKTGRAAEAAKMFEQVLMEDNVELMLADGRMVTSHYAALRGLERINRQRR